MSPVGVTVSSARFRRRPPAATTPRTRSSIGRADWGPVGQVIKITNLANAANQIGTPSGSGNPSSSRTSTCAVSYDACDEIFHEDGTASPTIYFSRVAHGTPTSASIVLAPSSAVTFKAEYAGAGGNGIYVACTNSSTYVVITLQDASGNTLAVSPQLSTLPAIVTWAATTGYVTATTSGATLPSTASATAMTGGNDNYGSATIADWQTALAVFPSTLGPGQVLAPGQVNSTLSGISSALATHANANNRVAVCNLDDNVAASVAITNLGTIGTSAVGTWSGFWAGNRNIAGVTAGTTRSVSPDSVIAGLCAQSDTTGNQNIVPAGVNYPLVNATTPTSMVSGAPYDTYSPADLATLNAAGINTFQQVNGLPCNYGFVTPVLIGTDQVYWQFNHARLRMALVAQAQIVGQPFVFAQIDGQGNKAAQFGMALQAMLLPYATAGALWAPPGTAPQNAFVVDTGSDVNTPASEAAGQLNATITVSFSYYAQNVNIQINVVPITQAV